MPIETIEPVGQPTGLVPQQTLFHSNNVVVAGTIKVKHPLLNEPLLLVGFVNEDKFFNSDDFIIQGMKIKYKLFDSESYCVNNPIIYPKVIIDQGNTVFYELFNELKRILCRGVESNNTWISMNYSEGVCKFQYYLFDKVHSKLPECAANEIYAVCKYLKNDVFKYAILNFHEITPEI